MIKIRASCSVAGENFSPKLFSQISSVKLTRTNERGDIGTKGRYQGKPMPYGSASVEVSNKAEASWSRLDDLLVTLEGCIEALRKAGGDEISLSVSLFHDGQCNFGFSKEEFRRIAALKVDMAISCYSDEVE